MIEKAFATVFREYIPSSTEIVGGKQRRRQVSPKTETNADREIKQSFPTILKVALQHSGRAAENYRVYGSVGQINWSVARIPWVAVLDRKITTSTQLGYYIVLLFRENMQGCALSLNQGFTEYERTFGTARLAQKKAKEGAALAISRLNIPSGFISGEIDLGATGDLGKGYEQGAIVSKLYEHNESITEERFGDDFRTLLDLHDELFAKFGSRITEVLPPAAEDDFQEAAAALSKKPKKSSPYKPPPPGPVKPPERLGLGPRLGYRRDVKVSGEALRRANYRCEADTSHISFVSRTTGENFVEAHHLIPMELQDTFEASLDVLENVIVLCPTCHRKLHHGRPKDKSHVLEQLFLKRVELLRSRGLEVTPKQLIRFYHRDLEED